MNDWNMEINPDSAFELAGAQRYRHGVAATAHPLATEAAIEMLRDGGNAIDAALAAAWALAVCEPSNSGLGGQTVMLVRPGSGSSFVLNGHSRAPAAAFPGTVTRRQQRFGYLATTIPTTPIVLETAGDKFGRLPLRRVLDPAIRLAEGGVAVTPLHRKQLHWCIASLMASPSASPIFLNQRQLFDVGEVWRQPALAATLRRLASHGADDFYHGEIARSIAKDMERHRGLLTLGDLATVQRPVEYEPISTAYRDCRFATVGPPAGGLLVLLGMKLLERFRPDELADDDRWHGIVGEVVHSVFEHREHLGWTAEQLANEDCLALLSGEQFDQLAERVVATCCRHVSPEAVPAFDAEGRHETEHPFAPHAASMRSDAEGSGETTHLCTADSEGNVVSLTQSIQSLFGARVACEPCGFLYNNYLVTCPRHRHPNQLRGGCLPRSNAAPTLVSRDGSTATIALGGAGSRRTISAILQTISGVLDRGISLPEAIAQPRIHVKLSRKAWLERSTATERVQPALEHQFRVVEMRRRNSYAMGCVQAIQLQEDGVFVGAADPRREGKAMLA